MEKELQSQLAAVIPSLIDQLKTGKDFVLEQAPDVIQQLLAWTFWSDAVFCFILSVFIAIAIRVAWLSFKEAARLKEQSGYYGDEWLLITGILSSISVFVSVAVVIGLLEMLKIVIAPKVWLIEYASHLVK